MDSTTIADEEEPTGATERQIYASVPVPSWWDGGRVREDVARVVVFEGGVEIEARNGVFIDICFFTADGPTEGCPSTEWREPTSDYQERISMDVTGNPRRFTITQRGTQRTLYDVPGTAREEGAS